MQPSTNTPATNVSGRDWRDFIGSDRQSRAAWGRDFVKSRKYAKPHRFFVFDTEGTATDFRGCGFLWHDSEGSERWAWLKDRQHAIAWLRILHGRGLVGYAHNLAYDLGVLLPQPWPQLLTVNLAGDQITEARFDGHALYDSMGLCRASVANIGGSIGLQKLLPDDGLETYCRRDCEIVYRLVNGMQTWSVEHHARYSHRIGSLAVNYASNAIDEPWPRATDEDNAWGERAMYPGRAEVYCKSPVKHVTVYDVNSMYPWLLGGKLPDPRTGRESTGIGNDIGFADVTVRVPEQVMQPLPYHAPDGQVYYPTGTWRGTFATCELAAAINHGGVHVLKHHGGYTYSRTIAPFTSYVQTLYRERREANEHGDFAHALSCKLLLNSLWGRLALRPGLMRQVVRREAWEPKPCGHCRGCRTDGSCDRVRGADLHGAHWLRPLYAGGTPDYVNRAWAAWVAARARVELRKLMDTAGADLVRCHTDSVTVRLPTPFDPGIGPRLGDCKAEYTGPIEYRSPNAWRDSQGTHIAGISAEHAAEYWDTGGATEERALSLLEGLAIGKVSTWRQVPIAHSMAELRPERADGGRRAWTVEELQFRDLPKLVASPT